MAKIERIRMNITGRSLTLTPFIMVFLLVLPTLVANPSMADDRSPTTLNWWAVEPPQGREDSLYTVHLGAFRFDPLIDSAWAASLPGSDREGPILVQANGPASMLRLLEMDGSSFDVMDIISTNTIVLFPEVDQDLLDPSKNPDIRSAVSYHPLFKVEGQLFNTVAAEHAMGVSRLVIGLYSEPNEDFMSILNDLCLDEPMIYPHEGTVHGTFRLQDILTLARLEAVSHVSSAGMEGPDNDVASGIIDVMEAQSALSLNGTGQIVAVVDTGLDTGQNATLHQDFKGRIVRTYTYGRSGNWSDADIHVWNAATSSWDYDEAMGPMLRVRSWGTVRHLPVNMQAWPPRLVWSCSPP